ncbi:hypothetical protein EC957_000749 [Mortierella hygrophila]|uniref:Major facilitator superfamily (MFS) profile domain-containing protein n=1 Tax=Mortierella hygrophila TaxID=979708 RepID=A0A9P6F793_9FUNG|nr:hypothetical protein EC957_000749 [Mortierella hygrophila]
MPEKTTTPTPNTHNQLDAGPPMTSDEPVNAHPFKELIIVVVGVVLGVFLAALDQTVASVRRFSDIFGRKSVFLFAITVFLGGSALCGAAQNVVMVIVARGIGGAGAGGLMSMVVIIITDLVVRLRARKAFFINLPIGAITLAVVIKLRFHHVGGSIREKIKRIDFLGALSLIAGLILLPRVFD